MTEVMGMRRPETFAHQPCRLATMQGQDTRRHKEVRWRGGVDDGLRMHPSDDSGGGRQRDHVGEGWRMDQLETVGVS
jgi:hypothetical protein